MGHGEIYVEKINETDTQAKPLTNAKNLRKIIP